MSVLDSFFFECEMIRVKWKKEPQLRKRFHQIGGTSVRMFSFWSIDREEPSPLGLVLSLGIVDLGGIE